MTLNPPYLDTDTISNAAELVNSTLLSKAYIDNEIKFVSINWNELLKDQITNLEITEEIYNNDKNNLNIIYSLLQALDRSKTQHKSSNRIIAQKDSTIATLNKKIESLEQRLSESESKLNKIVQFDQNELAKKVQELTHLNKLQSQDLNKLKNWCSDIKSKYHIELKKKKLEIDQLKNKLLVKRNLSSAITYGIPLSSKSVTPTNEEQNINSNIIYNNNPIIDNTNMNGKNSTLKSILKKEYEEILSDLTSVIESLVSENYKFTAFIKLVNEYYSNLNTQLSNLKYRTMTMSTLPNPSDTIDLNEILKIDSATTRKYYDEMESFEFIIKPVLNNIYRNYHNISNLVELIDLNSYSNNNESADSKKVEKLTEELEITRKNWQDAIKTLENWKIYHRKNDDGE